MHWYRQQVFCVIEFGQEYLLWCLAPTSDLHPRTSELRRRTFFVRHCTSEVHFCGKYLQNRGPEEETPVAENATSQRQRSPGGCVYQYEVLYNTATAGMISRPNISSGVMS